MSTVIKVENLCKRYYLSHKERERFPTLRDAITRTASNMGKRLLHPLRASSGLPLEGLDSTEEFWALDDVSFEVKQGDRVGIIGRNGAGKSTLLKVLSRITEPTKGRVSIKGRVASLLEVGTGFHPELTGRENIFLNGAILGMSRVDIRRKFDQIVAFAEVEKFLDTPVKRYSSGMYVRLAFAVAAHLEPEILIVDEVLAVGDSQFQKKCLGRMAEVGKDGRTVLFVSHNMAAIKSLCNRAILLNKGQISFQGDVNEAVAELQGSDDLDRSIVLWDNLAEAPGNKNIRLKSISVTPMKGSVIDIDSGLKVTTVFLNEIGGRSLDFTLRLFTLGDVCLFETGVIISNKNDATVGCFTTIGIIPPHLLNAGIYKIHLVFGDSQMHLLYNIDDVISFEVENTSTGRGSNMSRAPGLIRPMIKWDYSFH